MEASGIGGRSGGPNLDLLVADLVAITRLPASDHVAALITQDLKEPRAERPSDVEPVKRLPGLDERVL